MVSDSLFRTLSRRYLLRERLALNTPRLGTLRQWFAGGQSVPGRSPRFLAVGHPVRGVCAGAGLAIALGGCLLGAQPGVAEPTPAPGAEPSPARLETEIELPPLTVPPPTLEAGPDTMAPEDLLPSVASPEESAGEPAGESAGVTAVEAAPATAREATLEAAPAAAPEAAPAEQRVARLEIRLNDRRVYAYDAGDALLHSYPIAVGRQGWETPTGEFAVFQMIKDPAWEHPWNGSIVPPGPGNPLGDRWIGFWSDGTNVIGFHGTPAEELVGQAVSHGCIRMKNNDVRALFERVTVGTPVLVRH